MCFRSFVPLGLALLLLPACRDAEVRAYRVPKEELPSPPPSTASAQSNPHAPAAPPSALAWQAPERWEEKPGTGFRRGSFRIPGPDGSEADLSIIAFPGAAGGMTENLNRWRGQLGLPNQPEAEIMAGVNHLDSRGGLHFDLVDYAGTANGVATRILGAVTEFGGESWFFKLMGPDELVAAEKPAFVEFVQTVSPAQP